MIGPSRSAGAGRDALPRVRRCTSRRFFLLLLRTRTCAIGAEALSLSRFSICTFSGRAAPDRAGAVRSCPYQSEPKQAGVRCRNLKNPAYVAQRYRAGGARIGFLVCPRTNKRQNRALARLKHSRSSRLLEFWLLEFASSPPHFVAKETARS